jgi:hypothetical protein
MTKKIGLFTTGPNQDSYLYIEAAAGESYAIGSDDLTANFCVNSSAAPGAIPDEATANIVVSSHANGDIDFFPNGTGKSAFLAGNVDVTAGNLTFNNVKGNNGQIPIGSTAGVQAWAALTAGANITITNAANSITIAAVTGSLVVHYTGIAFIDSPYTAAANDDVIGADVTGGAISVLLPNAPATGREFTVKDIAGLAAASNITVTTVGGAVNIDGATSFVMNTAYESVTVVFNGSAYCII